ncbi:MAG: Ig domain-containing protein [Bacteroidaceae bacterium]|nr:Ig domain-containing protein [Bacteroidaceae bacterium]
MKKTILSLVVLFCTMTSVNAQKVLKGDMNDDGDLTIGDVTALVEMIKNGERVHIDLNMGLTEADNTKLYGTWETADHESIVIFDETGAVYNNKKYSYQYYPNLQKLVLSDTESGLAKVMLFVNKGSDTQISIFDNKIADFVLYDLSPEVVKVESITLSQTSLDLTVDGTETIVATVLPENAHQKVAWSSSDETVATVDENGLVTAVAIGTTTVICSATDGSEVTASCEVTVTQSVKLVTGISLLPSSVDLEVDDFETIEVTVEPEDADNRAVIWTSSDVRVATVVNGVVTAVAPGTATIACEATDGSEVKATCKVFVDHEYVDLGLKSGTLWAKCNVGATAPEDVGSYFAWGEIEPKSEYSWENYKHCNGANNKQTKYCVNKYYWDGEGEPDNLTVLEFEDDAAFRCWGENWIMPSYSQFAELLQLPKRYEERDYNGQIVPGIRFGHRMNGLAELFIPISGIMNGNTLTSKYGYYWIRQNFEEGNETADALQIYIVDKAIKSLLVVTKNRCSGMTIRPVRRGK